MSETTLTNHLGRFDVQDLCGWGHRDDNGFLEAETRSLVAEVRGSVSGDPRFHDNLKIRGDAAPVQRTFLFELARKVLGGDIKHFPQEVGDCVSFGAEHAIEYVQLTPLAAGELDKFTQVFPPYLWGMGRLAPDCGNNNLGRRDGSTGGWQAKAVMGYGCIALDAAAADGERVPAYSGSVARQWGNRPGPAQKWVDLGKTHLVRSAALVRTWDDVLQAVSNGYPVTIASNCGFTMQQQSDGFHHRRGAWGHQMCIVGGHPGGGGVPAHACILNNWGDVHGTVVDFVTKENWPAGTLRVTPQSVEEILSEQDSYAYSMLDSFPAQFPTRDEFSAW